MQVFCDILLWLARQKQPISAFFLGKRTYQTSLLQTRWIEFLVIALINLRLSGATSNTSEAIALTINHVRLVFHIELDIQ